MMANKFIIKMVHQRAIGNDLTYYYKGKTKEGNHYFGFQKNSAQRFTTEDEAIQLMAILEATNLCACETFEICKIRCRV